MAKKAAKRKVSAKRSLKKRTNINKKKKTNRTNSSATKKPKKKKVAAKEEYCRVTDTFYDTNYSRQQQAFIDAIQQNAPAVERFLKSGFDLNKSIRGHAPLCYAVALGTDSVVKLMIKKGADASACPALLETTSASTTRILLKAGANPNICIKNTTPLLKAIASKYDRDTVAILLKAGAKITAGVKQEAQHRNDPQVMNLLGLLEASPTVSKQEQDLYIPPLLSKPLKAGYRKVFDVTGYPPIGHEGLTIFICQVVPDRFLSPKESQSSNSLSKATEMVAKRLYGTVDECEFVRSDIKHGDCVLLLSSKNKFFYLKKPKKLFDALKNLDAEHAMNFYSLHSGRFTYRFRQAISREQSKVWRSVLKPICDDGLTVRVSEKQVSLQFET